MRATRWVAGAAILILTGCSDARNEAVVDNADDPDASSAIVVDDERALEFLGWSGRRARAPYRIAGDSAAQAGGVIVGRIALTVETVGDSAITPTHDLDVCHPFTETHLPSQAGGVGNAVVWLVGVTTGPRPTAARRASLTLDRCQLSPRVQVMSEGGTLQVMSRDAMMSSLRFTTLGDPESRTQVHLNDAGQIVPTSNVAQRPGLVAVRDDLHPWVNAYVAVTTHPFVAVTSADGVFQFVDVPPGRYTLAVWQEKLGTRLRVVRVTRGVETRVRLEY